MWCIERLEVRSWRLDIRGVIGLYTVGGHVFAVSADEDILHAQKNLCPFATESPAEEPIFRLNVSDEDLPVAPATDAMWVDATDKDMPRIEVYREEEGDSSHWHFRIAMRAESSVGSCLTCGNDFHAAHLYVREEQDMSFCLNNALMMLYAFRTASLQTLEMHASVVVREGKGFLFLGKSGTGKSTHARQWLRAFGDAWLLNDDNPILRVMTNGEVRVFGSPWSGKTPCYRTESVPVAAIVLLHQATQNVIRRMRLTEAYAAILSSASGLRNQPETAKDIYQTIEYIVTHVPCYHLDCLPNEEAAHICYGERFTDSHARG